MQECLKCQFDYLLFIPLCSIAMATKENMTSQRGMLKSIQSKMNTLASILFESLKSVAFLGGGKSMYVCLFYFIFFARFPSSVAVEAISNYTVIYPALLLTEVQIV